MLIHSVMDIADLHFLMSSMISLPQEAAAHSAPQLVVPRFQDPVILSA